jgi:dTDP-4-amino-4,6-dideoxygalactose transaminase
MHYPSVAGFSAFQRFATNEIDRSRTFESRAITLPLFPTMTVDQVDETCRQLALATRQSE